MFFLPFSFCTAQPSKIDSKAKLSIGYDDNVSERTKDAIESKFLQFYINSNINSFILEKTLLSLKIQDGFKYYDAKSLSNESILINNINLNLSHNAWKNLMPELSAEIRNRTSIHSNNNISPSEEAYLRGYAGSGLKALIFSDLTAKIFYNYKSVNFEDFDPFDRNGHELGLRMDIKLLPESSINVQYSREMMNFNKWNVVDLSRKDAMNIMNFGFYIYKYLMINANASYEKNDSNIRSYSYKGYMLSLLLAKSISENAVFELYTLFRSRKHEYNPDELNSPQIDIEDEERNVLMIKISRDIGKHCALEAQYDFRRNRSGIDERTYTKNVFSVSIVSDF